MKTKAEAVEQIRKRQMAKIHKEVREFGSFEVQYERLKEFRNELRKFYKWSFFDKVFIPNYSNIATGDELDHHILAYFATFDFKRVSWNVGGGGDHAILLSISKF